MGATRDDLFEEILYDYDICEFLDFALSGHYVDPDDVRVCVDDWEMLEREGKEHEEYLEHSFKASR